MRKTKSASQLGFTWHDRRRLAQALQSTQDKRTFQRVQAVLWIAQGHTAREVSQLLKVSLPSVYGWVQRYLAAHQPAVLSDGPRSGRPRAAPAIADEQIRQTLQQDPLCLGYHSTAWTVPLLTRHLQHQYGCVLSSYTLRRRMKQMGLRWKRPRYVFSTKEPHRAQKKGLLCGV
jgi:transposase